MKLIALLGAGALVAGTMTVAAAPAEAQRWGDRHDRGGWYHDRGAGWHGNRGWHGRGYGYGYGYGYRDGGWNRGGYGYRGGYDYGRPRVVCRIVRGYHGPERRCFRR